MCDSGTNHVGVATIAIGTMLTILLKKHSKAEIMEMLQPRKLEVMLDVLEEN